MEYTQQDFHINVLEMLAVKYALLSLCSQVNSCHVYIKSDSVTVVHYQNNMSG
jgi:ribonuclease HI